ncbi:MAG: ABC transporter permease [Clostridia bacterium]|nr:ABC transporter permease [Clostridia bacterium]
MGNLLRMDLFRMWKSRTFKVCLILIAVSGLIVAPAGWAMIHLSNLFENVAELFPDTADLSSVISAPFPFLNAMIAMIAACVFFYADLESGYIKNIAGQMPRKGYTVLSKFCVSLMQNLLFMAVGAAFNLIGTAFVQRIVADEGIRNSLVIFLLKLLLMQACCTILLFLVSTFRNKALGSVMAVLFGTGFLSLAYMGIDQVLRQFIQMGTFSVSQVMPDQLLQEASPKPLTALLVSAVTVALFLPLAIGIFDRKDIK